MIEIQTIEGDQKDVLHKENQPSKKRGQTARKTERKIEKDRKRATKQKVRQERGNK